MFHAALLAFAMASAPAVASQHYQAEPAAKPAQAKFVAKDILWRCGDAGCTGAKGSSRPAIVCASLVREVGALRSFTAGGTAFAAEDLQKCNARAAGAAGAAAYAAQN
jgi:hypothetical protein